MKPKRGKGILGINLDELAELEKTPPEPSKVELGGNWDVVTEVSEAFAEGQQSLEHPEDWKKYPEQAAHWALTQLEHVEAADKPAEINAETKLRPLYETGRWLFVCKVPERKTGRPSKASEVRTLSPLELLLEKFRSKHDRRMEGRLRLIGKFVSRRAFEEWIEERKAEEEPLSLNGLEELMQSLRGSQKERGFQRQLDRLNDKLRSDIGQAKRARAKLKTAPPDERKRLLVEKADAEQAWFRIFRGRFQELDLTKSPARPGEKPRAIITDPPYLKKYVFDPKYGKLFDVFGAWAVKHLAKNGVVAVMIGQVWREEIVRKLESTGLEMRWTLITEYERGKWARVFAANRRVLTCTKHVLVLTRKGEWSKKPIEGDLIHCGKRDKRWHPWQQEVETFEQIIDRLTDPGDLIVDPFAGTGTTLIAGHNLRRRVIGSELNKRTCRNARNRLNACYYNGNKWRSGYPEKPWTPPTFDEYGRRVAGEKIEVDKKLIA